jgi:hypothetical protein
MNAAESDGAWPEGTRIVAVSKTTALPYRVINSKICAYFFECQNSFFNQNPNEKALPASVPYFPPGDSFLPRSRKAAIM